MTTIGSKGAPAPQPAADAWPRVVVFGAGAVGCFYGAKLAEAGAPVTLIGRAAHVDAIRASGLLFESAAGRRSIAVAAAAEPDAVREADLVLVCVKTRDTEAAARTIAPLLRPDATVVSLQNGVENVALMRERAGLDPLAAVVYVAVSMGGPGHLRHAGRGDLVLGEWGAAPAAIGRDPERARRVAAVFERAGVPCPVADDVRPHAWRKLVMNCAFNAISALGRSHYGRMIGDPATRELMRAAIGECAAVARAEGVGLDDSPESLFEAAMALGRSMTAATSSTAQDLAAGRRTEIDSLNGYVARRAAELGVAAPVNRTLHTLVGLLEAGLAPG